MIHLNDGRAAGEGRLGRFGVAVADAGVTALAIATLLGVALDAIRPGSALHRHYLGSTGVAPLDTAIAVAFAALVLLLPTPLLLRHPRVARRTSAIVGTAVTGLAAAALGRHSLALIDGRLVATGWSPPVTLVALALVAPWTIRAARGGTPVRTRDRRPRRIASVAVAGIALVLVQLSAVGATDYRAGADAILVLGAKVHADGTPSDALRDRTRTACTLWKDGLAPLLVLSGGKSRGAAVSEPEAMRRIARDEGVPDSAIVLDESGLDTGSSVRFASALSRDRGWSRVLVVSHDYHLARIRLLADREGLVVRTVPAVEPAPSRWKAFAIPREVAAYVATWVLWN